MKLFPASNPIEMVSLPICFQMYEMIYTTTRKKKSNGKKNPCPILWNCHCVSYTIIFILAMTSNSTWVGRKVKFIMERSVKLGYGYMTTVKMYTNSCRRSYCRIYMTNITVITTVIMTTLKRKIQYLLITKREKTEMGTLDHMNGPMSFDLSVQIIFTKTRRQFK